MERQSHIIKTRENRIRRSGGASLELVMATAIAVPLTGFMFFLGIRICRFVFSAMSGLLMQPFL